MQATPQKKIPKLESLVNPRAELELFTAFQRIYEYIDFTIKQLQNDLAKQIIDGKLTPEDINSLIGIFSQPLAGSSVSDPLLQSIIQSFGPQTATFFFGGPIPSFRAITLADLPAGSSGYDRVQDEGSNLAQRATMNFVGAGVTATDAAGITVVTIPGGGGSSAPNALTYLGL